VTILSPAEILERHHQIRAAKLAVSKRVHGVIEQAFDLMKP
jgi:hypothetical protein